MPVSKKRGGKKAHNKRVRHAKLMKNHQVLAIEALKKKIWEEAKQRHEDEKNGKSNL